MTPVLNKPAPDQRRGKTLSIADTSAQDVQLAPPDPRRKLLIFVAIAASLVVLVVLAAPAVTRWANATVSVPFDRVRIATVTRGDLVRDVSVQGRVVAAVSPTLYATASGTITLNVDAGEQVLAGQVLANVISPELTNQLEQAESSLAQRKIELERQRIDTRQQALEKGKEADLAEVAVVAARREMRRAEEAKKREVIPLIDYEKAEDDLRNAELAYTHARADADLIDCVQRDFGALLGVRGAPVVARVYRWPRLNPQHEVGHLARLAAIVARLERLPGLRLIGAAFGGVGLPDCIAQARAAAARAAASR